MSTTAGQLREWVRFYSEAEDSGEHDDHGGIESPPADVLAYETWAKVRPLSSRELFEASQMQSETTHNLTIRYDPLFTPTPEHYVKFGSRIFLITGVHNVDERNEWYVVNCTEESRP
jgi:SPP1 family predicted phage head-tail adaptor